MLLEYIVKKENKDEFLKMIDGFNPEIKKLNDDYFVITASQKGNSEQAAKQLSDLNDLVSKFDAVVLTNGAAAYFNKMLYPLVNDFERKLRKLLYAASALSKEDKDSISNLEELDFGKIFEMLFLDREYWDRVKAFVVNKNKNSKNEGWEGYSSDLKKYLSEEKENLLWDRLLPEQVPTLRKRFNEIRLKRNDIMHAHNISKNGFFETRSLFKKVNLELDNAIKEIGEGALIPENYNEELEVAFGYFSICDGTLEISCVDSSSINLSEANE